MKTICVFCGSSMGFNPMYRQVAEDFGKLLVDQKIRLVYGGASVGLMNVLANVMIEQGGHVTGIMPQHLIDIEVAHTGLHEMIVVNTMSDRKTRMLEMSDAFVALPGGFGTLDEISEVLTMTQLRLSEKPLALLNVGGYFDHLLRFMDHGVAEGFIREEHWNSIIVSADVNTLLTKLGNFEAVDMAKWIKAIKTESNDK
ncbi:MAG: TIGR00730 family Rossman fold protein [Bacteroidales bacterium]|nr:TIGR00730 family Rossman fold protein [Bacteroidales bacterium]